MAETEHEKEPSAAGSDGSAEEAGGAGPRWMLSSQRSRSFSPLSRSIRRSFSCRVSHSW